MDPQLEAVRVLVVDDEESIREGTDRILSRVGCHVLKACNGAEALAILAEHPVPIVLLDMKMPGLDGLEVLRRIRVLNPETLVIVITGYATLETAVTAMKDGAYDFIPKPFDPDHLLIVVRRATEKLRLVEETRRVNEERRLTLTDLHTEKSRLRTIIESLPNGMAVTNHMGHLVLMNAAFRRLFALDAEKEAGRPIEEYIADEGFCTLVREISEGRHLDAEDIPGYELALGEERYRMAEGRPILGERQDCCGAVISVVDVTSLKLLDRLKSEFVAKVSHELRSPLSTIHEQLAVVLSDIMDVAPESDQQILARAKEKTFGLISLISDLLDLSRIEAGILCRQAQPVQIRDMLNSVTSFLRPRAEAKGQELVLELPSGPALPVVFADPLALESILGNLVTNAITYTPEGGEIRVSADAVGKNLRIRVKDTGLGIEARYLDRIFERFFRVRNDMTRHITGTGLGLPIVKELVGALQGLVEVESTPGQGSTFTVLLPL